MTASKPRSHRKAGAGAPATLGGNSLFCYFKGSMIPSPDAADLRLVSLRTVETQPSGQREWHQHPFHELCLLADNASMVGKAESRLNLRAETLLYFPPNERHGYWNGRFQSPRFWVLHFRAGEGHGRRFPFLGLGGAQRCVWKLSAAQSTAFKMHFWHLFWEHAQTRQLHAEAELALLNLLLVEVQRWRFKDDPAVPTVYMPTPEVLRLWQIINDYDGSPRDLNRRLKKEFTNYDSLRHSFRRAFGCSPRDLLNKVRIQHAKNALLESSASVKDVALQLGFGRQHEFTRLFRRQTGVTPTQWRERGSV